MTDVKEYLMRLGLNEYQAKVMIALFDNPDSDAKELSEESKIPYTKIYEVLDALERRGLVKYSMGKPKIYRALEPTTVINSLVETQKSQLKKIEERQNDVLKDLCHEIKDKERYKFEPKIWIIDGEQATWDAFRDNLDKANKWMIGLATTKIFKCMWAHLGMINSLYQAFIKRKIRGRGIYPSTFGAKDVYDALKMAGLTKVVYKVMKINGSENFGARQLLEGEIYNDFISYDKKVLMIPLKDAKGFVQRSLTIEDKHMVKSMLDYHSMLWEKAKPVGEEWSKCLKGMIRK